MNQSLDVGVGRSHLGDGHGDANVALFELALLLAVDTVADAVDNDVLVPDHMLQLFGVGKVVQLHVGFVAEIGRWLDFLELVVPDGGGATVRIDYLRANPCQGRAYRHAKYARGSEDRGVDA